MDISEKHITFIVRVKEHAKQETSMKQVASRAYLLFDPEDGGVMSLQNVG
jgi:hypothetical protein